MNNHLFYELFDKVLNLQNPIEADQIFDAIKEFYGVEHALYNRINGPVRSHQNCFIIGTYPDEWVEHYFESDYLSIDPVARYGLTQSQSFDWSDLPKDSKKVQQIFEEAADFGFGRQGMTIPIVGHEGSRATLNINAHASDKEWADMAPMLNRDLHIIAHYFHASVTSQMDELSELTDDPLTQNELEGLKWAASGKTVWETSVIMSISQRTVRFHLDQARRKLNSATKIQAVAKAVATGLINIS